MRRTISASNSFDRDEVLVLDALVQAALTGQPLSRVVVNKDAFARVARKVLTMKRRITHLKALLAPARVEEDDQPVEG